MPSSRVGSKEITMKIQMQMSRFFISLVLSGVAWRNPKFCAGR